MSGRRVPVSVLRSTLAATLVCLSAATALGEWPWAPRSEFGQALYPIPWPDPSDPGVGGKERYVPYYPGYYRHAHGLFRFMGNGVYGDIGGPGESWATTDNPSADFGIWTGASREEEVLLHLGGNAPFRPTQERDIIDAIQGPLGPGAPLTPLEGCPR